MSVWHEAKSEDVVLSEDGKTIDVFIRSSDQGNEYIEIPIPFIKKILKEDQ